MAGVTIQRSGGRIVELLVPYEFQGVKYEAIGIAPCLLDHTLRWREGLFKEWFTLLVELAHDSKTGKPMRADDLRQLRYPDADRVIETFMDMLPEEIKQAVRENYWPTRVEPSSAPGVRQTPIADDSSEQTMQPDAGFDIGDDG